MFVNVIILLWKIFISRRHYFEKKNTFTYCGLIALIVLFGIHSFKKDILIPTSKIEKTSENQTSFLEKNPNTLEG